MPRYKLTWTRTVGYQATVIARDKAEANDKWDRNDNIGAEEDGFNEMDTDSLEIEEILDETLQEKVIRLEADLVDLKRRELYHFLRTGRSTE